MTTTGQHGGWNKGLCRAYSMAELDAVERWLGEGDSAAQIAVKLSRERGSTVTRNAIIGLVKRSRGGVRFDRPPTRTPPKASGSPDILPKVPKVRKHLTISADFARSKKAAAPTPQAPRTAYDLASRHVSLADLGRWECRWPVNRAEPGEEHLFCGHRTKIGLSYCPHHMARNYRVAA